MSVILQLYNENGATPYKINIKFYDSFIIFTELKKQENQETIPQYKPLVPFMNSNVSTFNLNLLYPSPSIVNILIDPINIFTKKIALNITPFYNIETTLNENKDIMFTITNIS
jgi:hypothetical protein